MLGSSGTTKLKVALINSIVARNDAISASVVDTYRMLSTSRRFDLSIFAYRNDFSDVPFNKVSNISDLILHENYINADLLIWHFGIYYELFNSLLIGNGHAPTIVRFHNITPKEYVPKQNWPVIDLAVRQSHLLRQANELWADSVVNANAARDLGVPEERIRVIPLVVNSAARVGDNEKNWQCISILFVGRFVPSKGVLDLLHAIQRIRRNLTNIRFKVDLVGNVEFSNQPYLDSVSQFIKQNELSDIVTMHGTVDDNTLSFLYSQSHILAIPSYHEGFCKPVIEALGSKCIPIAYDAYNLPFIVNGLGRIVRSGDIAEFGNTLLELITDLNRAAGCPDARVLHLANATLSWNEFCELSSIYIEEFKEKSIGKSIISRIDYLHSAASITTTGP